jgi:hypothetical protein
MWNPATSPGNPQTLLYSPVTTDAHAGCVSVTTCHQMVAGYCDRMPCASSPAVTPPAVVPVPNRSQYPASIQAVRSTRKGKAYACTLTRLYVIRWPLLRNVVANVDTKGTPAMQEETVTSFLANEADQLVTQWAGLVRKYALTGEDVTCTLIRQRNLANSLNQRATEELAIVTALRRGLNSPSSRRQISAICRIDTGIAS